MRTIIASRMSRVLWAVSLLFLLLPRPSAGAEAGAGGGYSRTTVSIDVPDVTLVGTDGVRVSLREVLDAGKPVMLNFIFATCPSICPLMSAVFSSVRDDLGESRSGLRMVSITIDPEHDTPEVLGEYAKLFEADKEWLFLTGTFGDIEAVQRAFGAFERNKMNHAPLTFLRASPGSPWVRIGEIVSAEDLAREARAMMRK